MADCVIDCSAIIAVVFGESESAEVAAATDGLRLRAPAILPYEIANACAMKVRRGTASEATARYAAARALGLDVALERADHVEVFDLALQHNLTAYDAAYLWLARRLDAPLVTLDRALRQAHDAGAR